MIYKMAVLLDGHFFWIKYEYYFLWQTLLNPQFFAPDSDSNHKSYDASFQTMSFFH
jgi:hypothetical protein